METDLRLFGLDLAPLGRDVRAAWAAMGRWPLWAWLAPRPWVRVLPPEGPPQGWRGGRQEPSASPEAISAARYTAVLLPEAILLHRQIGLPALPAAQIEQALALDVQTSSPFAPDQLLAAHTWRSTAEGVRAGAVLTSRALVQAYLARQNLDPAQTEVWVPIEGGPALLAGFGEAVRQRRTRAGRWLAALLALGCLGWLLGMAVTPTLQLRQRALQAVAAFDDLGGRAAGAVREREALVLTRERLDTARELAGKETRSLAALDTLTRALPDETFLLTLNLQGASVRMTGQTPNAAELMKQLGALPGISEVRAPTPAIRPFGAVKEGFTIELLLALPAPAAAPPAPATPAARPPSPAPAPAPTPTPAAIKAGTQAAAAGPAAAPPSPTPAPGPAGAKR